MIETNEEMVRLSDDELEMSITVILAAHSQRFPQLRGKGIRPDLRDDARRAFARELVGRLRQSGVTFYRRNEDLAGRNSRWCSGQRR